MPAETNGTTPTPAGTPATGTGSAQAPVTTSVVPQGAVFAADDMLVEQVINGERRMTPVRELRAVGQTLAAAQQQLQSAKDLRAQVRADEQAASAWREFQAQLARDPDATVEGVTRLARLAKGEPVNQPMSPTSGAGESDPQLQRLSQRMSQIEAVSNRQRLDSEITAQLDRFPMFTAKTTQSDIARAFATQQLRAAVAAEPMRPLSDVADTVHTQLVDLQSHSATNERDLRQTRAQTNPTIPANAGSPQLSEVQTPKPTLADLRSGKMEEMWKGYLAAAGRAVFGKQ